MSSQFCAHAEEAALILANVDLNGTMGIAYIGGAISCMYVLYLFVTSRALTTISCGGQDIWCNMHPDFPLLPVSPVEGRRLVPEEHREYHTLSARYVQYADDSNAYG